MILYKQLLILIIGARIKGCQARRNSVQLAEVPVLTRRVYLIECGLVVARGRLGSVHAVALLGRPLNTVIRCVDVDHRSRRAKYVY